MINLFRLMILAAMVLWFTGETNAIRCNDDMQCDTATQLCYKGNCRCQMGYSAIPNGFDADCHLNYCSMKSEDCRSMFGNSACSFIAGEARCVCEEGSAWDPLKEVCEVKKIVMPPCATNTDCGLKSLCHDGKCTCELGYVWRVLATLDGTLSRQVCVRKACSNDEDCLALFPHTKCTAPGTRCVCNDNSDLDIGSQSCRLKNSSTKKIR